MKNNKLMLKTAGGLVLAFGVLTACSGEEAPAAAPAVTVTAEADPVVPQECLDALDAADDFAIVTGKAFGITSKMLGAAANLNAVGVSAQSAKLAILRRTELAPAVKSYRVNTDACREIADE